MTRRISAARIDAARAYAQSYCAGEAARMPATETPDRAAAHAKHRRAGSVANFLRAERYGAKVDVSISAPQSSTVDRKSE